MGYNKDYDEMKRSLEGSARRGQRTDLTSSMADEVWTRDKTAILLQSIKTKKSWQVDADYRQLQSWALEK